MTEEHHSPFELDAYWVSPGDAPLRVTAHVASCERCQTYLRGLDTLDATPARLLARPAPARRPWFARVVPVAATLALAAGIALFVRTRETGDTYVGAKGTPAVQVLVRRGEKTQIYADSMVLQTGDALAFRVACEGFGHVALITPGHGDTWTRLSDAMCPKEATTLPLTLVVDDKPGDERVSVVMSRTPLPQKALESAAKASTRDRQTWVTAYVFKKAATR